jgi:hypothetical protein
VGAGEKITTGAGKNLAAVSLKLGGKLEKYSRRRTTYTS